MRHNLPPKLSETYLPDPRAIPPASERITLEQARALFGDSERPEGPAIQTIRAWVRNGAICPDGRVKLRVVKIGNRRFTTAAWVERFLQIQNQAAETDRFGPTEAGDSPRNDAGVGSLEVTGGEQGEGPLPVRLREEVGDEGSGGELLPDDSSRDEQAGRSKRARADRGGIDPATLQPREVGRPFRSGALSGSAITTTHQG